MTAWLNHAQVCFLFFMRQFCELWRSATLAREFRNDEFRFYLCVRSGCLPRKFKHKPSIRERNTTRRDVQAAAETKGGSGEEGAGDGQSSIPEQTDVRQEPVPDARGLRDTVLYA